MAGRRPRALWLAVGVALIVAGCSGGGGSAASRPSRSGSPATTVAPTTLPPPASTTTTKAPRPDLADRPCQGIPAPTTYQHVVVVMMENRTWSQVGGVGFGGMPYLASLAQGCAFYAQWTNTNPNQSSLTQYIGLTSGIDNPHTVGDCSPSASCSSTDDNVFRQVREAGGTARSYVEGATAPCSLGTNAAKHIPALYYRGTYQDATGTHDDSDFCAAEVLPLGDLDPNNLPTFAMVTPSLCNDGHDCGNSAVDAWARTQIGAILSGSDYLAGTTAVFVLWDESDPVPNLIVAPSAEPGPRSGTGSHASALVTIEQMLGLSVLAQGQLPDATSLRATAPV
jgi:hypothetical protein